MQPNGHAEERDYEIDDFLRGGRESVILESALSAEDDDDDDDVDEDEDENDRDSHSDES